MPGLHTFIHSFIFLYHLHLITYPLIYSVNIHLITFFLRRWYGNRNWNYVDKEDHENVWENNILGRPCCEHMQALRQESGNVFEEEKEIQLVRVKHERGSDLWWTLTGSGSHITKDLTGPRRGVNTALSYRRHSTTLLRR